MKIEADLMILARGVACVSLNLGTTKIVPDESYYGGLLSAVMNLSDFTSEEVSQMNLDQNISVTLQYDLAYEVHYVFISQKIKLKQIQKHLTKIRGFFHELYQPNDLLNWSGDLEMFAPFIDQVNKYCEKGALKTEKKVHLTDSKLFDIEKKQLDVVKELEQLNNIEISNLIKTQEKNIIELDLSNLNIMKLPEGFGHLKRLKSLNLMNNELTSLPESFGGLQGLENLNINNNRFIDLPTPLGKLKKLTKMAYHSNPWVGESKLMIKNSLPVVLDYCRKKSSIVLFISHAVKDLDKYEIEKIAEYLETQPEIYKVFYCERDLVGDIDQFMDEKIPISQLLLFIGTNQSVFKSEDCKHEIDVANKNDIGIIPIKTSEVNWEDLSSLGLSRELGLEFIKEEIEEFLMNLYKYIKQYKRQIDLFDKEKGRIDKFKLEIKTLIVNELNSEEFTNFVQNYYDVIEPLLQHSKTPTKKNSSVIHQIFDLFRKQK